MMQAADLGYSNDDPQRRWLNVPRERCIPLQGEMRPGLVVVAGVFPEDPSEMVLAEDDQMVQAFSANGSDHPLHVGVLPGGLGRGEDLPDPYRPDDPPELVAVSTIPIPQQEAMLGSVSGEGLPDLLRGPGRGRMRGDVDVQDAPAVVGENHEAEEQTEGGGRDHEEAGVPNGCAGRPTVGSRGTSYGSAGS